MRCKDRVKYADLKMRYPKGTHLFSIYSRYHEGNERSSNEPYDSDMLIDCMVDLLTRSLMQSTNNVYINYNCFHMQV